MKISLTLLCLSILPILLFLNSGCTQITSYAISNSITEMSAMTAVGNITKDHPYIDFNRLFPDTYRFELSSEKTWQKITVALAKNNLKIIEKNKKKGYIFTKAKKISIAASEDQGDFKTFHYQYSIFLTSVDKNRTYVTCYPAMFEGFHREIVLPMARNWFKGIFFGALAAEIYPEKKRESLIIAKKLGKIIKERQLATTDGTETVHTMQSGETLGKIAKKYTGKVMNYKEIAKYNNIKDINKIKVGQQIRIPPELIK